AGRVGGVPPDAAATSTAATRPAPGAHGRAPAPTGRRRMDRASARGALGLVRAPPADENARPEAVARPGLRGGVRTVAGAVRDGRRAPGDPAVLRRRARGARAPL